MGAQAVVLGASGFTGGELARLLAGHPSLQLSAVAAHERAGARLSAVHPQLSGATDLDLVAVSEALEAPADVCFSCLPSGALAPHLDRIQAQVVDLAQDFRFADGWIYGVTEFVRDALPGAGRIANPGCYPTAALLALLPFARAGLIEPPVSIDALSGISGAGRKTEDRLLFATADANAAAYGTTEHRHLFEIENGLRALGGLEATVSFTPILVPLARGLLVVARARPVQNLTDATALDVLEAAYRNETFIAVTEEWPGTKAVSGTNRVHLTARVDVRAGWLVCSAAIDNLGKGAAGQAIQNANVALGLEESAGLGALGVWP